MIVLLHPEQAEEVAVLAHDLDLSLEEVVAQLLSAPLQTLRDM